MTVCSEHFTDDDYKRSPSGVKLTDLLYGAVPTIFEDNSNPQTSFFTNR